MMRTISEYQSNTCKWLRISDEKENVLCDFNLTATLIFQFWIDSQNYFYGKFHTYTKKCSIMDSHVHITSFPN